MDTEVLGVKENKCFAPVKNIVYAKGSTPVSDPSGQRFDVLVPEGTSLSKANIMVVGVQLARPTSGYMVYEVPSSVRFENFGNGVSVYTESGPIQYTYCIVAFAEIPSDVILSL